MWNMQQFAVGLENLEFYPLLGVARALTHLPLKTHSERFSVPHSFTSAYQTPILKRLFFERVN